MEFQSTPPVRGATLKPRRRACFQNISIHAPRAGGDAGGYQIIRRTQNISIHAPRAGGDMMIISSRKVGGNFNPRPPCGGRRWSAWQSWSQASFQSTPPVRGATHPRLPAVFTGRISIHAPRAGGDVEGWEARETTLFQSTPPVRGATVKIRIFIRIFK